MLIIGYTELLKKYRMHRRGGSFPSSGGSNSPPVEGWQAQPDGVVFPSSGGVAGEARRGGIPLLWRGGGRSLTGWYSPPLEGWRAKPDGVVASFLHKSIPLLWRGGRHKHFVMHAFSNHDVVLHNVTPIDLLAQSAVLSDGVVASFLHQPIPLLWRGGRRSLTGWSCHFCTSQFPSSGGVAGEARRGGRVGSATVNSPPVEGWRA